METSISYTDHDRAFVSTDEPKWHRALRAYADEYPDQVIIKYHPETNDGNMIATVPVKWIKIKPPKRVNISEEKRAALSELMRIRNTKSGEIPGTEANDGEEDDE